MTKTELQNRYEFRYINSDEVEQVVDIELICFPPHEACSPKMMRYLQNERERGRKTVILTCLDEKVEMYQKMGYQDIGLSASVWGGEAWHDMSYEL